MRTRKRLGRLAIWTMTVILLYACAPALTGDGPAEDGLVQATASLTSDERARKAETLTSEPADADKDWQSYDSTGGHFSIQYPAGYTFYEGERPSVDGFVAAAPHSVSVYKASDPSFVLTIEYKKVQEGLSTQAFAQQDDICVTRSDQQAEISLDRKPAVQYTDTLCGPYGSTVVYLAYGSFGYRFTVESGTNYRSIEEWIQPILDTFRIEEE